MFVETFCQLLHCDVIERVDGNGVVGSVRAVGPAVETEGVRWDTHGKICHRVAVRLVANTSDESRGGGGRVTGLVACIA